MKEAIVRFFKCSWVSIIRTVEHDGVEHAGYMSFMVLFSLFPFLVFFLVVTSLFGASELGSSFIQLLLDSMPDNSTSILKNRIEDLSQVPPQRLMTLAIIGSIWTASSFVEGLRTILNRVYHIESPPPYLTRRLLSIIQFFVISIFLSLVTLILILAPIALSKIPNIENVLHFTKPIMQYWRYVLIVVSLLLSVSCLYYMIPNVKIRFVETLPGSFYTVVLWIISAHYFSKYIIYYNQLNLIYGSLGSIIITMLFFYIINMLFIYGAVFNYIYHKKPKAEAPAKDYLPSES